MESEQRKVTIRDIAKILGVSPATVSTALTGRRNGVFVSEATRRRVWEVARELGYPFERLRARTPQLRHVALFCTSYHWSLVFINAIMEFANSLSKQGGRVLLQVSSDRKEEIEQIRELHRRREVDGFILIGSRNEPEELPEVDIPYVVVGEVPEGVPAWNVCADNEGGGRLIAEHLWKLGHRRVGAFLMESNRLPSIKRIKGLRDFWKEMGESFPDDWVLHLVTEDENELAAKLPEFIYDDGQIRFTALFCYNDSIAGTTIKCLRRLGIKVPEEISVVGFDNEPYSELFSPPLTTVEQPLNQLVASAAQLLLERLASPPEPAKRITLPCRFIARASTTSPLTNSLSQRIDHRVANC